jgi:hypothetical protein
MEIEFTRFNEGENLVSGIINDGEYKFDCKLFDEDSHYGIDGGRVSQLTIWDNSRTGYHWVDGCIFNYDRGLDIEPQTNEEIEIFKSVLEFLENSPKTRFAV